MRTIGAPELALLAGDYNVHAKLEVLRNAVWHDVTNLSGVNWFHSAEWRVGLDDYIVRGSIRLLRETQGLSLAPLIQASALNIDGVYDPLIYPSRDFRFSTAITAPAAAPAAWTEVWRGRMSTVDWSGRDEFITLDCLDLGVRLNRMIRVERVYSNDSGVALETIMQQILNDNGLASFVIELPTGSPATPFKTFKQATGVTVFEALRALAMQIGWDFRMAYNAAGQWVPILYEPDRNQTVAVHTFAPNVYEDIPQLNITDMDVRNYIEVKYFDEFTKQFSVQTYQDAASIARFDERWARFEEGSTNNLKTLAEVNRFGAAALSDLSTPPINHEIKLPYWWPAQINDVYGFAPNYHYDLEQHLACVGFRHEIANGEGDTYILTRDKPATAHSAWIRRPPTVTPEIVTVSSMPRFAGGVLVGWSIFLSVNETCDALIASTTGGLTFASGQNATIDTRTNKQAEYHFDQAAGGDGSVVIYPATTAGHRGEPFEQVFSRPPVTNAAIQRISRTEFLVTLRAEPAGATIYYRSHLAGSAAPAYAVYSAPLLLPVSEAEDRILQFYSQIAGSVNTAIAESVQTIILDDDHKAEVIIAQLSEPTANELMMQLTIDDDCSRYEIYSRLGASPLTDGVPDPRYKRGEFLSSVASFRQAAATGTWHVAVRGFDFNALEGPWHEASLAIVGTPPAAAQFTNVRVQNVAGGGSLRINRIIYDHTAVVDGSTNFRVHVYEAIDSEDYVLLTPGTPTAPTRAARLDYDGTNTDTARGSFEAPAYARCAKTVPPTSGCNFQTFYYRVELWDISGGTLLGTYYTQNSDYVSGLIA